MGMVLQPSMRSNERNRNGKLKRFLSQLRLSGDTVDQICKLVEPDADDCHKDPGDFPIGRQLVRT